MPCYWHFHSFPIGGGPTYMPPCCWWFQISWHSTNKCMRSMPHRPLHILATEKPASLCFSFQNVKCCSRPWMCAKSFWLLPNVLSSRRDWNMWDSDRDLQWLTKAKKKAGFVRKHGLGFWDFQGCPERIVSHQSSSEDDGPSTWTCYIFPASGLSISGQSNLDKK